MRYWSRYGVNGALEMTFMNYELSAGLLSLACVVQNGNSVNINSLLTRYSFAEAADELKLHGEIAL